MKTSCYILVIVSALIGSCKMNNQGYQTSLDTLVIPGIGFGHLENLRPDYRLKFGIVIPNYLDVYDSLFIDLNRDNHVDTIAILSPISVEDLDTIKRSNQTFSRYLVEIINDFGRAKIRSIYPNLISNYDGISTKYSGMHRTDRGFCIVHSSGSRYAWKYVTEFSTSNPERIQVEATQKECSFDGDSIMIKHTFEGLSPGAINVPDSIRSNCGCDPHWEKLEKSG